MDIKKINIINYKCFDEIEISNIKPINIIIGKNNVGKSSILDVIEFIYDSRKLPNTAKILITKSINENTIKRVFPDHTTGGEIPGNHYLFGKKFIDKNITFKKVDDLHCTLPDDFEKYNPELPMAQIGHWASVASLIGIEKRIPKRILAERNVFPEDNDNNMNVDSNGNGVTRIITNFLNRSKFNEELVRINLLDKLNEIMGEDAHFTEITTQQIEIDNDIKWEIYLREETKGRIALSASGSGLKTILMVLAYTILIPSIENKKISNYIFLFEELENNLHPSLQRRLFRYLEEITSLGAILFLTTHSNIILDSYQNNEDINIMHLQKENNKIILTGITNTIQKKSILDDLGIKASDLLQSNGIIWVEGPSDRIYIKKWLELFGLYSFKEGKDYQCVFYGGRLLSNMSFEEETELVNFMSINRNAIIVLDSDKKNKNTPLNQTKRRIIKEAKDKGITIWLTKGREIENYIPDDILKRYYNNSKSKRIFEQFENIEDYIEKLKKGEGKKFLKNKISFARDIMNQPEWKTLENKYDLRKKINEISETIREWNKNC